MLKKTGDFIRSALSAMQKHYLALVLLCALSMLLGSEFFDTQQFSRIALFPSAENTAQSDAAQRINIYDVLNLWDVGENDACIETSRELMDQIIGDGADNKYIGHSKGVFADIANKITSGYFFVQILILLSNLFHSRNAAAVIVFVLLLLIVLAWLAFVRNIGIVVTRRLALEGRSYKKLSFSRVRYLLNCGQVPHVAGVMMQSLLRQTLWYFTLVGGVVQRYAYYLVPYVIAENPYLSAKEAISLSKRMMRGHKRTLFLYELCLLITPGISLLTCGLSDILLFNPFRISFFSECYAHLRAEAFEKGIAGVERLNDRFLFCGAQAAVLEKAYAEACAVRNSGKETAGVWQGSRNRVSAFMAKWFGIVFWEGRAEREYEARLAQSTAMEAQFAQLAGEQYPLALSPIRQGTGRAKRPGTDFLCHYSIWSLILLFFLFSMLGWAWEVGLYLLSDGVFVNRGMLHGPWLPIYGSGGIVILALLYRFRSRPGLEFSLAILLAGVVEFMTSYIAELSNGGLRWWDYEGYFLNLNGRICAEGLLVFGIAGMLIVYLLAPWVNQQLRKLNGKAIVICALLLTALFCFDLCYSHNHPNTGEGITSVSAAQQADGAASGDFQNPRADTSYPA